jgi:hypothetical protein
MELCPNLGDKRLAEKKVSAETEIRKIGSWLLSTAAQFSYWACRLWPLSPKSSENENAASNSGANVRIKIFRREKIAVFHKHNVTILFSA